VVQMNAAGATTITVNTALFAAGDSVQIQNVGAGVCTITAGTATVSTAGSLALSQYEGGQLYFNTTSAALFFDIVQSSGMTNPMTTTGDIIYSSSGSTPARLGIGTTGQVVTVASGLPSWATPASGGMAVIATGTLSSTSVVVSSIPGTYKHLMVSVYGATWDSSNDIYQIRYNSVTTNYTRSTYGHANATANNEGSSTAAGWFQTDGGGNAMRSGAANHWNWIIYDYTATTGVPNASGTAAYFNTASTWSKNNSAFSNQATAVAITSITIMNTVGNNQTGGTYTVYGVS